MNELSRNSGMPLPLTFSVSLTLVFLRWKSFFTVVDARSSPTAKMKFAPDQRINTSRSHCRIETWQDDMEERIFPMQYCIFPFSPSLMDKKKTAGRLQFVTVLVAGAARTMMNWGATQKFSSSSKSSFPKSFLWTTLSERQQRFEIIIIFLPLDELLKRLIEKQCYKHLRKRRIMYEIPFTLSQHPYNLTVKNTIL